MHALRAALLAGAVIGTGCSTTAHITLRDGSRVDGEIVDSDRASVVVRRSGEEVRVPRDEIDDIDHPGNFLLTLGALGAGGWGLILLAASADVATAEGETHSGLLILPAIFGVAVYTGPAVWGYRAWSTSVDNARPPDGVDVSVYVSPGGISVRF